MATWRLAGAETLVVGDALDWLAPLGDRPEPDPRVALEALRATALVRVVAADLVPPGLAVYSVLAPDRAVDADVELGLVGRGDVRQVVWVVESSSRRGEVRRAVDAYTGLVLSGVHFDGHEDPAAIVLTRRSGDAVCDLPSWARCIVGLPLSIELDGRLRAVSDEAVWRQVVRGPRPALPV